MTRTTSSSTVAASTHRTRRTDPSSSHAATGQTNGNATSPKRIIEE